VDLGSGTAAVERTEAPAPVPSGRAERGPPEGRALSIDEEIGPMFDRMAEVARTYASTTTVQRVDVTDLLSLRDRLREAWDDPLPTTALVVRAAADCLPDYPLLNAAVEDEEVVRTFEDVNVGVAVDAGDSGLLVPTVYDADDLTLRETGREVERLSTGAREGTLDTADLRNGTFTVSNAGGLGAYINTPMINPPQTAVLGVCTVVEEPALQDGEVVPRKRLHLCLTYDHRVVAGTDAVGFLSAVRSRLETPETLLS
jgi:pyruvate/2-oxoglutarate dehydrogenase complex dihydrolipoamide acyltransferase (E2) component